MQKQVIIEVDEFGEIHFETDGFIGEECITNKNVKKLKEAIGRGLGPDFKPVFYQKDQKRVIHKNLCG